MNRRVKILMGLAMGALLAVGVAVSAHAQEPAPADGWQQMWQWCHGGGGAGTAYLNPTAAAQVAKAFGITTQDLYAQRAAGKSISDIAKAKEVSEQQLLEAALAPYNDSLALRVKYGYITQAQADQALKSEEANLRTALNATGTTGFGPRGSGMMGGFGGMMGGFGSFGGMMGGVDGLGGMMGGSGGMMGGVDGLGGMMGGSGGMMGGLYGGRGMMGGRF